MDDDFTKALSTLSESYDRIIPCFLQIKILNILKMTNFSEFDYNKFKLVILCLYGTNIPKPLWGTLKDSDMIMCLR